MTNNSMQILYHPRAIKFLGKIPPKESQRVISAIEKIQDFEFGTNIKKLVTTKRSYRMRVGNIRVIFELDSKRKRIYIHEIDFRGNVY